jgi:hypothetical protein
LLIGLRPFADSLLFRCPHRVTLCQITFTKKKGRDRADILPPHFMFAIVQVQLDAGTLLKIGGQRFNHGKPADRIAAAGVDEDVE